MNADTGERKTKENTRAAGSPLEPLDEPHPSARSDRNTKLHFLNHLDTEVELFWIDQSGNRVSYRTASLPVRTDRWRHSPAMFL